VTLAILMRGPIIFVCVGGNIEVFRDGAHAVIATEAIDVVNGEYGEYGWDADGRPIALEARLPKPTKLFGLPWVQVITDGKVNVRTLDAPPEPDVLRSILLNFWLEHDPARATSLSSSSLEELVASMRGFIGP
jgi:hypothetical protein